MPPLIICSSREPQMQLQGGMVLDLLVVRVLFTDYICDCFKHSISEKQTIVSTSNLEVWAYAFVQQQH